VSWGFQSVRIYACEKCPPGARGERAGRLYGGGWCACCVWPVLQAHDNRAGELGKKGWAGSLTGQGPFDELPVVIDQPGKQPQVHNRAIACGREVDDLADGGGVHVSGNDEGASQSSRAG
jgi:hypothetical protein